MLTESVNNYAIITDTSCIILLDKIDALGVLHATYTHLLTTPQVAAEFRKPLPDWIQIKPAQSIELIEKYAQQN